MSFDFLKVGTQAQIAGLTYAGTELSSTSGITITNDDAVNGIAIDNSGGTNIGINVDTGSIYLNVTGGDSTKVIELTQQNTGDQISIGDGDVTVKGTSNLVLVSAAGTAFLQSATAMTISAVAGGVTIVVGPSPSFATFAITSTVAAGVQLSINGDNGNNGGAGGLFLKSNADGTCSWQA